MSSMEEIYAPNDIIYTRDYSGMHIRIWVIDTDGSLKEISDPKEVAK